MILSNLGTSELPPSKPAIPTVWVFLVNSKALPRTRFEWDKGPPRARKWGRQ